MAIVPGTAGAAAAPPLFTHFPPNEKIGTGAGQTELPFGLAVDERAAAPSRGHVYAVDNGNARIDEFTAWGSFVKAWGWGVLNGASELQTCTTATGCLAGMAGTGQGQVGAALGIAVDPAGDVYVVEREGLRVEKFDSDGNFLLSFGGEVNKTTGGEVCAAASGDTCGTGVAGTGPGEFAAFFAGNYVVVSPSGTILVGDEGRVQEFETDGTYVKDLPDPEGLLSSDPVQGLAIDGGGNVYVTRLKEPGVSKDDVLKLSPSGNLLCTLKASNPRALATDRDGNVFVSVGETEVLEFGPSCAPVLAPGEGIGRGEVDTALIKGLATSAACGGSGWRGVYLARFDFGGISGDPRSYVAAFGPQPDLAICPPPLEPPTIVSQHAASVATESATVRALINPHFWNDTNFYVEYGTGECRAGGCGQKVPVPSRLLGAGVINTAASTVGILLDELQPGVAYHYRFVAQSTGGGPVFGVDPDGEENPQEASFEEGREGAFATFRGPNKESCPGNAAARVGAGAALPDCRAYEMVSPVDKSNGDIVVACNGGCELQQSTGDGGKLTYSSYRAFGEVEAAPLVSQYLAERIPGKEWSSHSISPPRQGASIYDLAGLNTQYKAFSPSLCGGWLLEDSPLLLTPDAVPGYGNLYRRSNCGSGGYELISTINPPSATPLKYIPKVQGFSADESRTVFRAEQNGLLRLYLHVAGVPGLSPVSVLPNGATNPTNASVGTSLSSDADHRRDSSHNAVSADGRRIFWTATAGTGGAGTIYLRVNADQPQSAFSGGKCTEPDKACTLPVSGLASAGGALFWSAASDGSRAIFSIGEKLYEFTFDGSKSTVSEIADGVFGVAAASEDAHRVYFASKAALAGAAQAGAPNLYLYESGEPPTYSFVATLSSQDVSSQLPFSDVNPSPSGSTGQGRSTRVSPDGEHLAFMSTASLTGYDNSDAETDESASEVFLYDAGSDLLICASCDPSGAQPISRAFSVKAGTSIRVASRIPSWMSAFYATRALAEDGSRLFFESFNPLVLDDTNGVADVYEWEAAGAGSCTTQSGAFVAGASGCIFLISSGQGSTDSTFVDASADGSDVFFKTASSLLPQDPDLVDIYDARVNGGLPIPQAPPPGCEGSACQSPPGPPTDATPATAHPGPGNPPRPRVCPKGKHQVKKGGKRRCVPSKKPQKRGGARR